MLVLEIFDVGKSLSLERGRRRRGRESEGVEAREGIGERKTRALFYFLCF